MENNKSGKLIVFLKTSEEAVCKESSNCTFTYTNTVPTVNAMVPEWDASTNTWTIKLTGTGFTGDISTSELKTFGNKIQPPVAVLSSVAVFRVTDVQFQNVTNVKMYFDVGLPAGNKTIFNRGVMLTPKFVGVLSN
jgi:hypothetical protein